MRDFSTFFREHLEDLNEAVKMSDFKKVAVLIQKYLKKYVGKVYYYPAIETFSSAKEKEMKGMRFFIEGGRSIRLNWAKTSTVKATAGIVSMDYWDGTILNPKKPTKHIQFAHDESTARVLPFIKDFLTTDMKDSSSVFLSDEELTITEAYTDPDQLAETTRKVIGSLASNINFSAMGKTGGTAHYGPALGKVINAIKIVYKPYMKKEGVKIVVDPEAAKKFDIKKIVEFIVGDAVNFKSSPGAIETIDVPGVSDDDIERMSYEEQLDSLKTGMRLLLSNATNAIFISGRGGCLDESTEVNIMFSNA
jgi:hypothetical protein